VPFEAYVYNGASTPHRIFAMLRLISQAAPISRSDAIALMQPAGLNDNVTMATDIFRTIELMGLIETTADKSRFARIGFSENVLQSVDTFRAFLQQRIGGIVDDAEDHFLLNQFASWYAVQDDLVFTLSRSDYEIRFHEQLYPGAQKRLMTHAQSIPAWTTWAEFIGWGWQVKFGSQESNFIPDCTVRIQPLLPELLPEDEPIPFGVFMDRLAVRCPELDGGVLFERCWEASRPNERRGNRLSLMLSTALRVLNQQGRIALENRADATENWMLFAAQSYISRVTHIRLGIER
jgi:hypothetical protein